MAIANYSKQFTVTAFRGEFIEGEEEGKGACRLLQRRTKSNISMRIVNQNGSQELAEISVHFLSG